MLDLFEFRSTPTTGFALLGLGCGVGVGAGAPVRLLGVPILGDAVSGIALGLSALDASLGRPSDKVRAALAKVSSSSSSPSTSRRASSSSSNSLRLAAGAGCGLGLGYGIGVGLFVKKSAGEALKAKVAAAVESVRGAAAPLKAGLPAATATAAAAVPPSLSSPASISALESRIEQLEGLVCELRPEHGLCVARRKKREKAETDVDDEKKN